MNKKSISDDNTGTDVDVTYSSTHNSVANHFHNIHNNVNVMYCCNNSTASAKCCSIDSKVNIKYCSTDNLACIKCLNTDNDVIVSNTGCDFSEVHAIPYTNEGSAKKINYCKSRNDTSTTSNDTYTTSNDTYTTSNDTNTTSCNPIQITKYCNTQNDPHDARYNTVKTLNNRTDNSESNINAMNHSVHNNGVSQGCFGGNSNCQPVCQSCSYSVTSRSQTTEDSRVSPMLAGMRGGGGGGRPRQDSVFVHLLSAGLNLATDTARRSANL